MSNDTKTSTKTTKTTQDSDSETNTKTTRGSDPEKVAETTSTSPVVNSEQVDLLVKEIPYEESVEKAKAKYLPTLDDSETFAADERRKAVEGKTIPQPFNQNVGFKSNPDTYVLEEVVKK